jgi:prepilin-type N-terminal cleavage/methylation domain-containing protein
VFLHQQEAIEVRSRINLQDKNLIEKGFTLVELLVVIVILGVLAAVVVFAVGGITNTSKQNACKIEVRTVNSALQAYYANVSPSAYPQSVDVPTMFSDLVAAKLLSSGTGTASNYGTTPAYNKTTGVYTAPCT